MPRVPKWLGNVMETTFSSSYKLVVVSKTEYLDKRLKIVRFEGDFSSVKEGFIAGNVIEFRVSDTDYRHYTPSYFSVKEGVCDVIFYLHDKGPGSRWAESLKVGNGLKMIGPGAKMSYKNDFKYHVVFGDETSLGLFQCMEREASKNKHQLFCISELDPEHADWIGLSGIQSGVFTEKKDNHELYDADVSLQKWLADQNISIDKVGFYLTGNARSIQSFRKILLAMKVNNKQMQTYPYWSEGKKGL